LAIFLTEYRDHRGRCWSGPDIEARTWKEAAQTLSSLKRTVVILGPLVERIDAETGERIAFLPPRR